MRTTKATLKKEKKKSAKKKIQAGSKRRLRNKRIVFALNEDEYNALLGYCNKYKIANRSHLIRTLLMTTILKKFNEDYPSLFDDQEMH